MILHKLVVEKSKIELMSWADANGAISAEDADEVA